MEQTDFEDFKNLDLVKPKLFRAARQDAQCNSNCMGFVVRIFDAEDVALLGLRLLAIRLSSIVRGTCNQLTFVLNRAARRSFPTA
jgi:hypothetical protein